MNERSILIVDSDQKNLMVMEANFREASFVTATAKSDNEALRILKDDSFNIVLCALSAPNIDGYQVLKEIQRNPAKEGPHVIFLSIKSDIWNRVKSLKLGAKDYIVKPVHASEVLARVNMVIRRLQREGERQTSVNNQISGRLEDLAVIDLIEIFGAEKKTGILTINNENGHSGQIVFNRGQVISTNTQALRSEEAVYKMMHWNRGRFSMLFTDVHVEDEFTISNMGLLLQGAKRMDLRNELLKQLPSLEAVVITTSNFKKITSQKEMNSELKEFLTLFDGERTLGRILDDSHENEIVTLKRMVKLYKLGFLHVLRNFSKERPLQFRSEQEEEHPQYVPFDVSGDFEDELEEDESASESDELQSRPLSDSGAGDFDLNDEETFLASDEQDAFKKSPQPREDADAAGHREEQSVTDRSGAGKNLIVISTKPKHLKLFIENLASDVEKTDVKPNAANIYLGAVKLRGGASVNVLGMTPDEAVTDMMLHFSKLTLGCMLLIDSASANWNYHRYLYKTLRKKLNVPILIVCIDGEHEIDLQSKKIRDQMEIDKDTPVRFISAIDPNSVRRVLFTLLNASANEKMPEPQRESFATK